MSKFPDPTIQIPFTLIIAIFVWTYAGAGHRAAHIAHRSEKMLQDLRRDIVSSDSEVFDLLYEAQMLRKETQRAGLSDFHFSTVYERQLDHFSEIMTADLSAIDAMKSNLFFLLIFFVFLSFVGGVVVAVLPKTIEDLHPFLFGLMNSLALAYVPGIACLGSLLVLNYLQSKLQPQVDLLKREFDLAVLRVAIIGTDIRGSLVPLGDARGPTSQ